MISKGRGGLMSRTREWKRKDLKINLRSKQDHGAHFDQHVKLLLSKTVSLPPSLFFFLFPNFGFHDNDILKYF